MSFQQDNLQAIADAIRDMDGTTDPIMPLDFPDRIRAIQTGTQFPSGGSSGQALVKNSNTDGDIKWGNVVSSFNGRTGAVAPQSGDYTAAQVGAVPTTRTVNNKALSSDIILSATDVNARPSDWTPIIASPNAIATGSSLATGMVYLQYE